MAKEFKVKNPQKGLWKDKLGQKIYPGDRIAYASQHCDSPAMKIGIVLSYTIKAPDWRGKAKVILNILNEDGKKVGLQRFPTRMIVISACFRGTEKFSRIGTWADEENQPGKGLPWDERPKSQAANRFISLPFVKEILGGK